MNINECKSLLNANPENSSMSAEMSLPRGYPAWIGRELITLTQETWREQYGETLTETESADILVDFGRLLDYLAFANAGF